MRNIKLTLAYDGTDFSGWQIQPGAPTIQGAVTEVLRRVTQEEVQLYGAGRTDAGVHALGQVAHFQTGSRLAPAEFQHALNALLPATIRVMHAEEVAPEFHARHSAIAKTYSYRIFRGEVAPPFSARYVLHVPWPLDEAAMMEAARLFEGQHDFTMFSAAPGGDADAQDANTLRTIFSSLVKREGSELRYTVYGRSFLRYMVRRMVGTLLEVGRGRVAAAEIPPLFDLRDRSRTGPTAPPQGLCLDSIEYP